MLRIIVVCEIIFFAQSIDTSRKYVNARAVTSRTCAGANGSLKISQSTKRKIKKIFFLEKFTRKKKSGLIP
jgi:hypothetical protein